ncbi:MAG TPA: DUF302 domain-containing protein [Terriglobales bacterium]|nr:DUF302 domain-containing protein [Terriglobales bacterium]
MIYSKGSERSLQEVDTRLREAAARHKFGVLHMHDLAQTLAGKGITLGKECRVYDVCNPQAASSALQNQMAISSVLPCRISVFSEGHGCRIATVNPTDLMSATGISGVEGIAGEVEREIKAIIDEAA